MNEHAGAGDLPLGTPLTLGQRLRLFLLDRERCPLSIDLCINQANPGTGRITRSCGQEGAGLLGL